MSNRSLRLGLFLSPAEKYALDRLAELDGGLSYAAMVRRLIRLEATRRGLLPLKRPGAESGQEGEQ